MKKRFWYVAAALALATWSSARCAMIELDGLGRVASVRGVRGPDEVPVDVQLYYDQVYGAGANSELEGGAVAAARQAVIDSGLEVTPTIWYVPLTVESDIAGWRISSRGNVDAFESVWPDALVSLPDRGWARGYVQTWIGDANLDLVFDSDDLIQVAAAGLYETGEVIYNGRWQAGDWDFDYRVDSADMLLAAADGGYGAGVFPGGAAMVPEPSAVLLMLIGLYLLTTGKPR